MRLYVLDAVARLLRIHIKVGDISYGYKRRVETDGEN
jgi:hypothetical protein